MTKKHDPNYDTLEEKKMDLLPPTFSPVPKDISEPNIAIVIDRALHDPSLGIDVIERMLALRDRERAFQAECAFNEAMGAAQEAMSQVSRDMDNPSTNSKYASLAAVDRAIRQHYTKQRFSITSDTLPSARGDSWLRVETTCSHPSGHSITRGIDLLADGIGPKGGAVMTRTHATISAVTYARRALLKMIFNLAEADDDGNIASKSTVNEDQLNTVKAALADAECDSDDIRRFCKAMKIEGLEHLRSNQMREALARIKAHKDDKAEKAKRIQRKIEEELGKLPDRP
jgi:hypothetical protein